MGINSAKGLFGTAFTLGAIAGGLYVPAYFFFPLGISYIGFGLIRAAATGLLERLPDNDPLRDEDGDTERQIDEDSGTRRSLPFKIGKRPRSGGSA